MNHILKRGLVVAIAMLFVVAGIAFAADYSDKAMKEVDGIKALKDQKKEMPATLAGVKNITTDDLKKWLDEGKAIVVLDNRTSKEYETEHIPGAKWVGTDELLKDGLKTATAAGVKKEDTIVNY